MLDYLFYPVNVLHQSNDMLNYRQMLNGDQLYHNSHQIDRRIHFIFSNLSVIASIKTGRISFIANSRAAFVAL